MVNEARGDQDSPRVMDENADDVFTGGILPLGEVDVDRGMTSTNAGAGFGEDPVVGPFPVHLQRVEEGLSRLADAAPASSAQAINTVARGFLILA